MICDLAETYQIFDYRRVPGRLLGTLVAGLGANSRVRKKQAGIHLEAPDSFILASILDDLEVLKWWQTKDGRKGRNRPEMLTQKMTGQPDKRADMSKDANLYKDGASFEAAREKILRANTWLKT